MDPEKDTARVSPVISGDDASFVYMGEAESVYLVGEYNRWELKEKLQRSVDSGIWYIRKQFPRNARFEYKFVVDGRWMKDPLNRREIPGDPGNSILVMPEYRSDYEYILNQPAPSGTLANLQFDSHCMDQKMRYHVYLPPDSEKVSIRHVLYALDGSDYLNFAKMNRVLDFLIYNKKIPQTAAVLLDPSDRDRDFTVYEPFRDYVIRELMPRVESKCLGGRLASPPERFTAGVSWGGLTAIYVALGLPGAFSGVLSQSGSFWPKDYEICRLASEALAPRMRFCLQAGTIQDTEEMNDMMAGILKSKNHTVKYTKYAESHNWSNWRGHLDEGLMQLLT